MASFELIDTAMRGKLSPTLLAWRAEGISHDAMAQRMAEKGYPISRETIRRWFVDIDAAVAS